MKRYDEAMFAYLGVPDAKLGQWRELECIRDERERAEMACQQQEQAHLLKMQELKKVLRDLQGKCPHPVPFLQHYPDASGGYDSEEECLVCGKMAKKL